MATAAWHQGDTPGRLKKIKKPPSKERYRDLSSYAADQAGWKVAVIVSGLLTAIPDDA
jgi:hypothetical protein